MYVAIVRIYCSCVVHCISLLYNKGWKLSSVTFYTSPPLLMYGVVRKMCDDWPNSVILRWPFCYVFAQPFIKLWTLMFQRKKIDAIDSMECRYYAFNWVPQITYYVPINLKVHKYIICLPYMDMKKTSIDVYMPVSLYLDLLGLLKFCFTIAMHWSIWCLCISVSCSLAGLLIGRKLVYCASIVLNPLMPILCPNRDKYIHAL